MARPNRLIQLAREKNIPILDIVKVYDTISHFSQASIYAERIAKLTGLKNLEVKKILEQEVYLIIHKIKRRQFQSFILNNCDLPTSSEDQEKAIDFVLNTKDLDEEIPLYKSKNLINLKKDLLNLKKEYSYLEKIFIQF